jgi:hypothetical protein
MRWLAAALFGAILVGGPGAQDQEPVGEVVAPWWLAGDAGHLYEGHLVPGWKASGYLASTRSQVPGFGTIGRDLAAGPLRGRRVRLRAEVRTEGVRGWAGLWLRVDGPLEDELLAFDNMVDRPIQGDTPWRPFEVVLDVGRDATNVAGGFLVDGPGRMWVRGLTFDVVGADVPATDQLRW